MGRTVGLGPDLSKCVKTFLIILWRFVKALPLVLLFPILLAIAMAALALADLASAFRKKALPPNQRPD